jgi:tryptophan-rich sensory protein
MDWLIFTVFLAACIAAGTTGALFEPGPWYRALAKPRWTPPDWLFPVAWFTLYICMSLAAMRVATTAAPGLALAFWSLQIALNTLWTPIFFGLKRMGAALVVIVALWLSVAATMVTFWQIDLIAGLLFLPYIAWVSVAGALNFTVWWMNRGTPQPAA